MLKWKRYAKIDIIFLDLTVSVYLYTLLVIPRDHV